jgi:glutathione-regulated potassium-efflux system ancillary protein KefG
VIETDASVLVLFAHPTLEKSRVNRYLVAAARETPGVTFHDLYECYPDFYIDVAREQALLEAHATVVLQHPFFWYSTPAIVKQWEDLVLEHGWAYGADGTALHGKTMLSVVTTGGRESAYQDEGYNRYAMADFLVPIAQTARLCGMTYLPPFLVHGTHRMTTDEMQVHARDYRRVLEALRDGRIATDAAARLARLNADLDAVIVEGGP